jgi:hypothetical protein
MQARVDAANQSGIIDDIVPEQSDPCPAILAEGPWRRFWFGTEGQERNRPPETWMTIYLISKVDMVDIWRR